jgi:hypothetical protein
MYEYVNSGLAPSREMEFHADEVVANVAGIAPFARIALWMQDPVDASANSVLILCRINRE